MPPAPIPLYTNGEDVLHEGGILDPANATLSVDCPRHLQRKVADIMDRFYGEIHGALTPDELKQIIIKADWSW